MTISDDDLAAVDRAAEQHSRDELAAKIARLHPDHLAFMHNVVDKLLEIDRRLDAGS